MQPPSDISGSRHSRPMTPSVPRSWATDVSSPFTSTAERLEVQGQDTLHAIPTSKNDRWEVRGNVL
eukprot:3113945-Alexandrium_andersonii.AAC.1